jgi:HD superfamily phosphohydrolase
MQIASRACERLFSDTSLPRETATRFRGVTRLAALLHDLGHGPLSHTTEFAMPPVSELDPRAAKPRKATHEDYTLKMILDSGLTRVIEKSGAPFGLKPEHVACLIDAEREAPRDGFFEERIDGTQIDFRPVLAQLVSSELDADRMDYLRRDSLCTGVSYGVFDFEWLLGSLAFHVKDGAAYLALDHRALYAFEDFLISRFHMFLMVYFHFKSVVYDEMLGRYFGSPDCDYALPSDIERYCECDDAQLGSHLSRSKNPWARRIVEKRPYRVLIEVHSGIPAHKSAASEQAALLAKIRGDLQNGRLDYIESTSTSELSKYFRKPAAPIYVRYDNHYSQVSHIPLAECTDLFQRYGEKRSITRLYVSPEDHSVLRVQGRHEPLEFRN